MVAGAMKPPCGVVAIHGGCGIIGEMTPEREAQCRETLANSVKTAMNLLTQNGTAVDAVVAAITVMEDDPMFNAGKGAVFATNGTNELDAGIMDGFTGAVGGVSTVKRFNQLNTVLKQKCGAQLDHDVAAESAKGTVGAVALDLHGHLACGSSTGGMSGKEPGRVSDSSIAGAGFYADRQIAVTGTGNGDEFIRISASKQVADLVKYKGMSLAEASAEVVYVDMKDVHAGFVALDVSGNVSMPFNTPGMFRARLQQGQQTPVVGIFKLGTRPRRQNLETFGLRAEALTLELAGKESFG